jgi:hypothetical protein
LPEARVILHSSIDILISINIILLRGSFIQRSKIKNQIIASKYKENCFYGSTKRLNRRYFFIHLLLKGDKHAEFFNASGRSADFGIGLRP